MRYLLIPTSLMLAVYTGCGSEPVDLDDEVDPPVDENAMEHEHEPDVGNPNDQIALMLEGADAAGELLSSPVHAASKAFTRIGVVYEAVNTVPVMELSTSPDGENWSAWIPIEGEDAGDGVLAGELAIDGEAAAFFRLRGIGENPPGFLSIELLDDTMTDEESMEDEWIMPTVDPNIFTQGQGLKSLKKYRFGAGKVTRPWLWLLRTARREGWRGTLAGTRTGLRTYRQQKQLWDLFQSGQGAPAFPPWGPSRHMIRNVKRLGRWAQAIDTQDVPRLIRIARRHGVSLRVPYSNEPWHVEATRLFRAPRGWSP